MFGLFKEEEARSPTEKLTGFQETQDWAGLAKTYYEMGVAAMDSGDLNHAQLWLHRADTVYSAIDEIYDAVGEEIVEDCSDRIGCLEDVPMLYNDIPEKVDQAAEELSDPQVRVWGLMTIARLVKLGKRLSAIPGCEVLGELDWAVDMMLDSFQTMPTQEEYQHLMDVCNGLYVLDGKPTFWCSEIDVPGGAPFQVFDLNGMMGVQLELNDYIDNHLRLLSALSQGVEELPAAGSEMVGCALLPDYYVRTGAERLEDVPQIKAELARIWDDLAFVKTGPSWEAAGQRIAKYKQLDILK